MAGSAGTGGRRNLYNRGRTPRFASDHLFAADIAPGDIGFVDDNVLAMGWVTAGSSLYDAGVRPRTLPDLDGSGELIAVGATTTGLLRLIDGSSGQLASDPFLGVWTWRAGLTLMSA